MSIMNTFHVYIISSEPIDQKINKHWTIALKRLFIFLLRIGVMIWAVIMMFLFFDLSPFFYFISLAVVPSLLCSICCGVTCGMICSNEHSSGDEADDDDNDDDDDNNINNNSSNVGASNNNTSATTTTASTVVSSSSANNSNNNNSNVRN